MLFTGREVRNGKNCARGVEYAAEGRNQDTVHSCSRYGPPGRRLTFVFLSARKQGPGARFSKVPGPVSYRDFRETEPRSCNKSHNKSARVRGQDSARC